ncbi:MAG TPA: hypothetical protein VGM05_30480, partial [Planctomycetaceae bacterium]
MASLIFRFTHALSLPHWRRRLRFLLATGVLIAAGCARGSGSGTSVSNNEALKRGQATDRFACRALAFSKDGTTLAAAGEPHFTWEHHTELWDTENFRQVAVFPYLGTSAKLVPANPSVFLTGGWFGDLALNDVETGTPSTRLRGHIDTVSLIEVSPDGRFVVSAAADGTAVLRDAHSLESIGKISGHEGKILSAVFTPDSQRLITGGVDKTVTVRDTSDLQKVSIFKNVGFSVEALALSSDGESLVTIGGDCCGPNDAVIWSIKSQQ